MSGRLLTAGALALSLLCAAAASAGPGSVSYRFHQSGRPDGHSGATFSTSGSGGRIAYAIDYPGTRPDRHYAAAVRRAAFTRLSAGRTRLLLIAKVTRSDDGDCPAGALMVVDLRDGGKHGVDRLSVSNRSGCNIPPLDFTAGRGSTVSVSIATGA